MFKRRKIINENKAVAGIVVALLLIGLFFTGLGIVQSVYVPDWMRQKESEHMEDVANQFTQLKFAIDTACMSEQKNAGISSSITLGSKEMPYLTSARAYGSLNINPNDGRIVFNNTIGIKKSYLLGNIIYNSQNAYYLNQDLVYENGAIILSQQKNDSIHIHPDFYVLLNGNLTFNVVQLIPIANKTSASGYGSYPIRVKFSKSESVVLRSLKNITIYSSYANIWKKFFNNTFTKYSIEFKINDITDSSGNVIGIFIYNIDIDPSPAIVKPDISIKKNDVYCQISHGSVE